MHSFPFERATSEFLSFVNFRPFDSQSWNWKYPFIIFFQFVIKHQFGFYEYIQVVFKGSEFLEKFFYIFIELREAMDFVKCRHCILLPNREQSYKKQIHIQ